MTEREFIEKVYEIAFGDDAINRDFSYEEVLARLREFSDSDWTLTNVFYNEDSGDIEMLQEQLHKFSPPQENDDE